MSSMLNELWPIFLAEVSEKLDNVESLILQTGEDTTIDPKLIDALFREFHTLKSSFSMVDFKTLMEITHACEDALYGLKNTSTSPDTTIFKHLLEAVDWTKEQLAAASPGQYPQHTNETLLTQLAPFRPVESNATPDTTTTDHQPISTAIHHNIAEEKEILALDTLRISSDNLDALLTQITQLKQQDNTDFFISQQRTVINAIKAIQQASNDTEMQIAPLRSVIQQFQYFRKNWIQHIEQSGTTINAVQHDMLELREVSLTTLFNRLPRLVRQKASALGKSVQLLTEGGDITIDKCMTDALVEPLIYILHSVITHELEDPESRKEKGKSETGHISILASRTNDFLLLEVRDDGCGNGNPLIREQMPHFGGSLQVHRQLDAGSRHILRLPIASAIQHALVVRAAGLYYAIPARHIDRILECSSQHELAFTQKQEIPIFSLAKLLHPQQSTESNEKSPLLVAIKNADSVIALRVDDISGKQHLFQYDIHQDLKSIPGVGGVSLLGNGSAIIILDCENLFHLAAQDLAAQDLAHAAQ